MTRVLELQAQRANIWEQMKGLNDRVADTGQGMSAEDQTAWDQWNADLDRLAGDIDRETRLEGTRMDRVDTSATHPGLQIGGPQTSADGQSIVLDAATRQRWARWQSVAQDRVIEEDQVDVQHIVDYSKAFNRWMRHIPNTGPLAPEDLSAIGRYHNILETKSGAAGGYLIPPEGLQPIERAMLYFGGMRQVATIIRTASGADLPFPVNDDTGNTGEWLSEGGTVSTQDTTFGQRTMKAFTVSSKIIKVSHQLLVDSAVDLVSYIGTIAGERIGRAQNTAFTTGTGPNLPSGIVGDVTAGKTTATGTAILWDELIDLIHSVDVAYRGPNCKWMFHDLILAYLRKQKDGEGQYLWTSGTTAGEPDRIQGFPYVINNDMQSTVATGTTTVLFGDLSRYRIRDVEGMQMMRLDELYAAQLQVGFFVFARADGALIDAGQHPVKSLVQA